jgi:hypothetical protein
MATALDDVRPRDRGCGQLSVRSRSREPECYQRLLVPEARCGAVYSDAKWRIVLLGWHFVIENGY